jgi:hypothetical protein
VPTSVYRSGHGCDENEAGPFHDVKLHKAGYQPVCRSPSLTDFERMPKFESSMYAVKKDDT